MIKNERLVVHENVTERYNKNKKELQYNINCFMSFMD